MTERVDTVVVGAGVVGLACAKFLAEQGHEVIVLEQHATFGSETSSRNSEVIHAGIYYPPGSLKAGLCVKGRKALYDYCARRHIAHNRCGKLLVATRPAQLPRLMALHAQAIANGVDDVVALSGDQAMAMEPALRCVAALHSPSTGIVDSHGLMLALLADAEAAGAVLVTNSPVGGAECGSNEIRVQVGGTTPSELRVRRLINAAGLSAPALAARCQGLAPGQVPPACFARGNYFALSGKSPFSRLIYPMPEAGGTGVHLTLDLAGQARFGPDVQWLAAPDYEVDAGRAEHFYAEIRRYWPALPDGALTPAYAGVRPKISGPDAPAADFVIAGPQTHGVPGLINLFGIESPGLTAALAIGDYVARMIH